VYKFLIAILFLLNVASAYSSQASIPTVNPARHSGGLASDANNRQFQPSKNPIPLEPKQLSASDRDLS
jgi:hypothetical protein